MESIAERLKAALKLWNGGNERGSVAGFRKALDKRNEARTKSGKSELTGVTYPTLLAYIRGSSTPSLDFLQEAAGILNVREPWLICGEGGMTHEEETRLKQAEHDRILREANEAQGRTGRITAVKELRERIHGAFREHFPLYEHLEPDLRGLVWTAWQRHSTYGGMQMSDEEYARLEEDTGGPAGPASPSVKMAETIARLLASPLTELGFKPAELNERQREAYTVQMCQALTALLPMPDSPPAEASQPKPRKKPEEQTQSVASEPAPADKESGS